MADAPAVHAPPNTEIEPCGDLCTRTVAMPADTNQNGDIFGGWLLSQMDIGGGVFASKTAKSRTVTVAIEAMVMLDEKIDKVTIDAAAVKFGMPMGPIELADQVGLDICLAVGDMLRSKFGDLLPPTPAWLRDKVAKGELGRKTGRGFYLWKDGKADKTSGVSATTQPTAEMIDRLILPMSNVCVAALREGIVDNADVVDGAMIFGTGYAPFRGGPLNYARSRGPDNVVSMLQALAAKFGGRFAPDAGWDSFK